MLKLTTDKIHLEYQEAVDVTSGRPQIHLTGRNGAVWQRILPNPASASAILLLPPSSNFMFIAYDFDLYALHGHTGEILWQRHFDEPIWACHLLSGTDILVQLELSLARLNAEGTERWFYSHADIITEVQLQENQLRLTDFDENQFELNLTTGLVVSAALGKL